MAKYNSGRVRRFDQTGITSDRYQFLGLEQAEPDLGDPLVGVSSIGEKPYPVGDQYVVIAVEGEPGSRYWIKSTNLVTQGIQGIQGNQAVQGTQGTQGTQGLQGNQGIQGPLSNFQGTQGVQGSQGTQGAQGIQGNQGLQGTQGTQGFQGTQGIQGLQGTQGIQGLQGIQGVQGTQGTQGVQGELTVVEVFETSLSNTYYLKSSDVTSGVSTASFVDTENVMTGSGNVGIGTTAPSQKLHVNGNVRITGGIYDSNNNPGAGSSILRSTGSGIEWIDANTSGSGNDINQIQLGSTYYLTASNVTTGVSTSLFVDTDTVITGFGSVGIGTTNPKSSLEIYTPNGSIVSGISSGFPATIFGTIYNSPINIKSGWISEVDGTILSYAINTAQIAGSSGVTNSRAGAIFRLDSREVGDFGAGGYLNHHCFALKGKQRGEVDQYDAFGVDIQTGFTNLCPEIGSVLVGSLSSVGTGTPDQKLQVTGGSYISGNVGIGTTAPSQKLHVNGNVRITGGIYDSNNSPGVASSVLTSTGSGIEWGDSGRANIPQNSQASTYTLVASDKGKHISASGNVTVPSDVFNVGDIVLIYNNTAGNITVIQGAGVTLRLDATATTGTRTLAQRGLCTILCVNTNEFVSLGAGLS